MMSAQDGSVGGIAPNTVPTSPSSKIGRVKGFFAGRGAQLANQTQTSDQTQTDEQVKNDLQAQPQLEPQTKTQSPSQDTALDVADTVISQVLARRAEQAEQAENAAALSSAGQKERETALSPDTSSLEAATGIQVVEQERQPELPPEVDGFLQHVESHADQAPAEIVLGELAEDNLPKNVPKQSVIVVPITPEIEEVGAKKNPTFSVRWLVEWSQKLIKMFQGKVVYRQVKE